MNYNTQTAKRNENLIETLKKSIETSSMLKYWKQKIDLFTASVIIQVYNWLSDVSKEKLLTYEIPTIINFCYKLAK